MPDEETEPWFWKPTAEISGAGDPSIDSIARDGSITYLSLQPSLTLPV